jgi:hypothetical protein
MKELLVEAISQEEFITFCQQRPWNTEMFTGEEYKEFQRILFSLDM